MLSNNNLYRLGSSSTLWCLHWILIHSGLAKFLSTSKYSRENQWESFYIIWKNISQLWAPISIFCFQTDCNEWLRRFTLLTLKMTEHKYEFSLSFTMVTFSLSYWRINSNVSYNWRDYTYSLKVYSESREHCPSSCHFQWIPCAWRHSYPFPGAPFENTVIHFIRFYWSKEGIQYWQAGITKLNWSEMNRPYLQKKEGSLLREGLFTMKHSVLFYIT